MKKTHVRTCTTMQGHSYASQLQQIHNNALHCVYSYKSSKKVQFNCAVSIAY